MTTRLDAGLDVADVQRRTVRTLVVSQAVGAVGVTIGVATASLLARDISGSETMAGLAQTFQVLGTALAAYVLARVMRRRGRRVGLVAGYLVGATGAVLAVVAGVVDSMAVLLTGAVLLGATTAVNSSSRYAATDLATEEHRARALSVVVWATTVGAVAGPNLVGVGGSAARAVGIPELTGGFAIGAVVGALAEGITTVRDAGGRPYPIPAGASVHRFGGLGYVGLPLAAAAAPRVHARARKTRDPALLRGRQRRIRR